MALRQIIRLLFVILIHVVFNCGINAQSIIKRIQPKSNYCLFLNIDSQYYQPGASGTNCVWNFQGIQSTDSIKLFYIDAKLTPYHVYFPESNLAMTSDFLMFNYFKFDSTGYYQLGDMGYNSALKRGEYQCFKKAETMLKFPMHYKDSFEKSNYRFMDFCKYKNAQSTYTKKIIDAYGTLIINQDTFYNTLRTYEYCEFNDSIYNFNKDKSLQLQLLSSKYQWYADNIQAPLLSLEKNIRHLNHQTVEYVNNSMLLKADTSLTPHSTLTNLMHFNDSSKTYELMSFEIPKGESISVDLYMLNYKVPYKTFLFPNQTDALFSTFEFEYKDVHLKVPKGQVVEFRMKGKKPYSSFYLMIE